MTSGSDSAEDPGLVSGLTSGLASGLGTVEVADSLSALGVALFVHDLMGDSIRWSANAGDVLGLQTFELPRSARAMQRLLTPRALSLRLAATPPAEYSAAAPGYRVSYDLLPRGGRAYGLMVEEEGRWLGSAGGPVTGCVGWIRALPQQIEETLPQKQRLTGVMRLLSREELLAVLDGTLKTLPRDHSAPAAFLVVSVEDLPRINANYGYETGDRVIAVTMNRIQRRMRQGDILGHLSGHKYGAVLFHCSEHALDVAAKRFRAVVREEPVECDGARIRADVAIGAVMLPRHAVTASTALIRAEEALADGRADLDQRLRIYEPSPARDAERRRNIEFADEIQRGLDEGRFLLAYQPVAHAQSRRIVSYEALSRLVRRDGSIVSGGPYVAVAEKLGLIRRLDLRALALVLADLARCPRLRLSVNVSAETILDPAWLALLIEGARTAGDAVKRLTIEITETVALGNIRDLVHMAGTIREIGCRIAIDDFGSGHTSFQILKDLKPDWLKIDGAYIQNIVTDADSAVFVRALATLASHFRIETVAEFVQDEAAARLLTEFGISAFQGRLIGDPLLRITEESEAVLEAFGAVPPDKGDGTAAVGGSLRGEIAVGGVL